jgi:hypothetical protein
MADPQVVKDDAYEVLKATRRRLTSASFLFDLRSATGPERDQALHAITDSSLAVTKFRNARLEKIAAEMRSNDAGIEAATKGLRSALEDLNKIKPFLDAATAFLQIVARIVAIV